MATLRQPYRTLVTYCCGSTFTQTTSDYLNSFADHLPSKVEYLHVTHNAHFDIDLDSYDVVINNYCARYSIPNYVSEYFSSRLRAYKGIKIISVQDEYEYTNFLKEKIASCGFDIVLTCVPQDQLDYVYPQGDFPGTTFLTVLTGYVRPCASITSNPIPLRDRRSIVGYRGRDIGGIYGRLGFDKFEIGRRMKEICDERGLISDIAMDDASRIYGPAWFDFLGSCRAILGTESGSNVFDFDNSLRRRFDEMTRASGRRPSFTEFEPFIADREKQVSMGQISPRVFECALLRTPMIMFRGRYSGIIKADEHYIPLERDFSNVEYVLDQLNRVDELEGMAARAYADLIVSEKYSYARFTRRIADAIDEALPKTQRAAPTKVDADQQNRQLHPILRQSPTKRPIPAQHLSLQLEYFAHEQEVGRILSEKDQTLALCRHRLDWFKYRIYRKSTHTDAPTQKSTIAMLEFQSLIKESERLLSQYKVEWEQRHLLKAVPGVTAGPLSLDQLQLLTKAMLDRRDELYKMHERLEANYHLTDALLTATETATVLSQQVKRKTAKSFLVRLLKTGSRLFRNRR